MGLLPQTASHYAGRIVSSDELMDDPVLNLELGSKMLAELMGKYKDNVIKVATAYNTGGAYCSPAKGCTDVNRWGMRSDCPGGKTIDYPTRLISYSNGLVGVKYSGPSPVTSSSGLSGLSGWQWAGLFAVGVAGVVWVSRGGKLRGNPVDEELIRRASHILEYASPEETAELLAKSSEAGFPKYTPGEIRLAIRAGEILLKDRMR
jgi:hypothetical protein